MSIGRRRGGRRIALALLATLLAGGAEAHELMRAQPRALVGAQASRIGLGAGARVGATLLGAPSDVSVGVLLEGSAWYRFTAAFALRATVGWGLSYFENIGAIAGVGVDLLQGIGSLYERLGSWLLSGNPYWFPFQLLAVMMAGTILFAGVAVAALLIVLSPIAATSVLSGSLSASFTVAGNADVALRLEPGLGALIFGNRQTGRIERGVGPAMGLALQFGNAVLSGQLIWSPPIFFEERSSSVWTAGFTGGVEL